MRFNNKLLNSNIKKLITSLNKQGVTLYRISKETGIPHSSLKYMLSNRFEWKLNHLVALVSYLKQFNQDISVDYFLSDQKYQEENSKGTGDIRFIAYERGKDIKLQIQNLAKDIKNRKIKTGKVETTIEVPEGNSGETDLLKCLYNIIKDSPVSKNNKVMVDLKILQSENVVTEELKLTIGRFKNTIRKKS